MAKEQSICPICGEPTNVYMGNARKDKLCKKHGQLANAKKIYICEKCGKWKGENLICNCKYEHTHETQKCIICGNQTTGKPQCLKCYQETKGFMDELNKNNSAHEFRNYYYNLKDRILIIKGLEETKKQCKKLIAIALTNELNNDDASLVARVYKDVETLIKSKTITINNKEIIQIQKEEDKKKSKISTSQDGHNVASDMEVIIDDILYNSYILHCYGKRIEEIEEKNKYCDWFIPICNGKGIYIEYWGMEKADYLTTRKEKEELYKKYKIPYIGIEKDDPKKDTQTFRSNVLKELRTLAINRYGFMPEWKQ